MTDPELTENEATLEWRDGDMPYSPRFGDHFYCQTDGRLECSHVFLAGNGLPQRWQSPGEFRIGELGFGTGLNFCETWRQWQQTAPEGAKLHFTSFELLPMTAQEIDRALAHWPEIDAQRQALVALWPEDREGMLELSLGDRVRLTVVCAKAQESVPAWAGLFDAWFLDGFAPSRNPDMWSVELMQSVFDKTASSGSFATYAAAGFVRRNLQSAGFAVERRPGFAGKREMLCGTRVKTQSG